MPDSLREVKGLERRGDRSKVFVVDVKVAVDLVDHIIKWNLEQILDRSQFFEKFVPALIQKLRR